jgi:hypothetical protein
MLGKKKNLTNYRSSKKHHLSLRSEIDNNAKITCKIKLTDAREAFFIFGGNPKI